MKRKGAVITDFDTISTYNLEIKFYNIVEPR
jgi:hypothetical protein